MRHNRNNGLFKFELDYRVMDTRRQTDERLTCQTPSSEDSHVPGTGSVENLTVQRDISEISQQNQDQEPPVTQGSLERLGESSEYPETTVAIPDELANVGPVPNSQSSASSSEIHQNLADPAQPGNSSLNPNHPLLLLQHQVLVQEQQQEEQEQEPDLQSSLQQIPHSSSTPHVLFDDGECSLPVVQALSMMAAYIAYGNTLVFRSRFLNIQAPLQITARQFTVDAARLVGKIHRHVHFTVAEVLHALYLTDEIGYRNPRRMAYKLRVGNFRSVFVGCLLLSLKVNRDFWRPNTDYATLLGKTSHEICVNEIRLLNRLHYNVAFPKEQLERYWTALMPIVSEHIQNALASRA